MRRIQFERSIHTPTKGNKSPINSIQFIEISISTPLHTKTVVRSVGRSISSSVCANDGTVSGTENMLYFPYSS